MDEKTTELIRELADKLGTTGEHLWGVLVRQAPITGTIDLLVMVVWAAAIVWSFRLVRAKTARPEPTYEGECTWAEWSEEGAFAAWFIWGIAAALVVATETMTISSSIAAIVNPEYWALKQILP